MRQPINRPQQHCSSFKQRDGSFSYVVYGTDGLSFSHSPSWTQLFHLLGKCCHQPEKLLNAFLFKTDTEPQGCKVLIWNGSAPIITWQDLSVLNPTTPCDHLSPGEGNFLQVWEGFWLCLYIWLRQQGELMKIKFILYMSAICDQHAPTEQGKNE